MGFVWQSFVVKVCCKNNVGHWLENTFPNNDCDTISCDLTKAAPTCTNETTRTGPQSLSTGKWLATTDHLSGQSFSKVCPKNKQAGQTRPEWPAKIRTIYLKAAGAHNSPSACARHKSIHLAVFDSASKFLDLAINSKQPDSASKLRFGS